MTGTLSKIPPQNLEAESSVLGSMLVDPATIPVIAAVLSPKSFYRASHEKICAAIFDLWSAGQPVDLITVADSLKGRGQLDSVGGATYLTALGESVVSFHAKQHAEIVKELWDRRRVLDALRVAEDEIYTSASDTLSTIGRLNTTLASLVEAGGQEFVPISDVVVRTVKEIEEAVASGGESVGIPTGLAELDKRFSGILRGELWTLAGRTSLGKSALAAQIARGAAERGFGVGIITVEMRDTQVVRRMISSKTSIENRQLRRGTLADFEVQWVIQSSTELSKLPLWTLDRETSWDRAKAKVRIAKLKHPELALVVVDYVGLLSAPVPTGERYREIGRISAEAKQLAGDLQMGVILVSQLSRKIEDRADQRPRLSDLRESGNLEQDSDVVGLLFQEEGSAPDRVCLNIAKNRDGETGVIPLAFDKKTLTFSEWREGPFSAE